MIPVVGFVFDTANAIWYWNKGGKENKFMSICSMVSALPGIGEAIVVFTKRGKTYRVVTVYFLAAQQDNKK